MSVPSHIRAGADQCIKQLLCVGSHLFGRNSAYVNVDGVKGLIMRTVTKVGLVLGCLAVVVGFGVDKAVAHSSVFVGVGVGAPVYPYHYHPYYYRPYYGWPPAVAYVPPPVIYSPPPVIYAPPPVAYQQAPQTWYYCSNPQGYYPHVPACNTGWRQVPAAPLQ
jgi:hypothetical protein